MKFFLNLKFFKFFTIFSIFLVNPKIIRGDDIERFAEKIFNHYEYDDKINNYLKSIFSFGHSKTQKSLTSQKDFFRGNSLSSKHTFKIKSKNKMIYKFGKGQSLQINPSNINDEIIYNKTPSSYFVIKKNSVLYGININF